MSKLTTTFLLLCFGFACAASVEAVCQRCIEANRNNASNPNTYFYYDDYVKSQGTAQPKAQAPRR